MQIWGHTLVKNEERYLWFAVESVINHIDKLLLWDTGSTDKTKDIIALLKDKHKGKIETRFLGEVTPGEFTKVRQEMLDATKSDWFIIVDGDEVWWDKGIRELTDFIREEKDKYESIVSSYYNIVGDIFHYQEEKAGMYEIDESKGHINIRAVNRNIPGLHFAKPHGQQGLYDKNGVLIQGRNTDKRYHFKNRAYLHFTNVIRSSSRNKDLNVPKRNIKLKHELGISFAKDFYYPEVFFRDRPDIVPSPWLRFDKHFLLRSFVETPLRKVKRRYLKIPIGY